jgi:S1-C subfamily serine protease
MAGRVVGIPTAIFSRSGGSHGIGFAIPSNLVKLYVDSAVSGRKVERPWLGAKLSPMTRELAEALGLDRVAGAAITRISAGGPATEAALEVGDVIVAVDGHEVADARTALYRLTTRGVGNKARLDIVRKGKRMQVEITLRAAPAPGRDDVRNLAGQHPLDGARVSNILPGVADELGIDDQEGVVILSLRQGSTAARLGLKPGDVIIQILRQKVESVSDLDNLLKERQRMWQVVFKRGTQTLQMQIPG